MIAISINSFYRTQHSNVFYKPPCISFPITCNSVVLKGGILYQQLTLSMANITGFQQTATFSNNLRSTGLLILQTLNYFFLQKAFFNAHKYNTIC